MVKNIIFDFGGVFINLDKEATARMLVKLGFAGITPELMELFIAYETGIISTELFLEQAKKWVPKASNEELRNAWNSILLDFPTYRLQFLEGMARSGTHRLFLLSNTNALHLEKVEEKMGTEAYLRFKNAFDHCYFSHEIHLRKPEEEIFTHVLTQQKLDPAETLFIDDTEEHILTAEKLGLRVWHLQIEEEDIVELNTKLEHAGSGS